MVLMLFYMLLFEAIKLLEDYKQWSVRDAFLGVLLKSTKAYRQLLFRRYYFNFNMYIRRTV